MATDRRTQLVGSLHGSLYLMLIAWLALLDRVTSVTLPYYFRWSGMLNYGNVVSQALITNTNGTYHQLIVSYNGTITFWNWVRTNTPDFPDTPSGVSTGRVDYMCPTTDTTCTAGTGSYYHPSQKVTTTRL